MDGSGVFGAVDTAIYTDFIHLTPQGDAMLAAALLEMLIEREFLP